MRASLFGRLLAAALLLIAVTLFAVDSILSRFAAGQRTAAISQQLATAGGVLRGALETVPESQWTQWVRDAAARTRCRVMIRDTRGSAIADSESGGVPPPSNWHMASFPLPSRPALALILYAPPGEPDPAAYRTRGTVFGISLGSALLALATAYLVWRSLAGRVNRLEQFAHGLVEGPKSVVRHDESRDDLASLERTLAQVGKEIRYLLERLRFESARWEAILSSMAEGVLAVDRDLRVTFCNDAFLRAVGARRPIVEHMRLLELVRDPGLLGLLSEVIASGEARRQLLKIPAAARSFEVNAVPLPLPGGSGAIAVLHDTTEIERLEQVRKDFVANVSHELRTPLAGIIGYTDTLLEGALEDPNYNRSFLEIIRSNAIQLSNITSDLLTLSELESGGDPPEPEQVSVREVLEAVLVTVRAEAAARDVRLIPEVIEDAHVLGFRRRLEQAVLNLVANAIKFNRPGGEVRVGARRTADDYVRITVSDTGVGIPSQDLPRVFERFYRVDKSRSRRVGGTGLGLSIVKHVVERMNGSISVESQLGKGTNFTVSLPASAEIGNSVKA